MKNRLALALASVLLSPGLLHAGCSIGSGKDQPQTPSPPPPLSTTTVDLPALLGSNPGNTLWLDVTGTNVPPGASTGISRIASNTRSERVTTLDPTPPDPPPTGGGGNRCDSIRTSAVVGGGTSYIERAAIADGLGRHLIELDMTYYQGNSNPVSGERSWWPIASWILPTGAPNWGSSLRVDYSGWQTGYSWSNPNSIFNIYQDDVLVGSVVSETNKPKVELTWSEDGDVSLIFDIGPVPTPETGSSRIEVPVVLENPVTVNFQPSHFQVGRVYLPYWLRQSLGTIYAYSHLMEGTPNNVP